jgi:mono/diheme cytochrome c family protein
MKRSLVIIIIAAISVIAVQCGTGQQQAGGTPAIDSLKTKTDTVVVFVGINSKGEGRFDSIKLTHPLDEKMIASGQAVYQSKCFACHKLTSELLVGPGWAGVTDRRKPEWIMNWITNTKVMLNKDLAAQADMAVCLIRMPNQDLTDEQARDLLEFMRKNDGKN